MPRVRGPQSVRSAIIAMVAASAIVAWVVWQLHGRLVSILPIGIWIAFVAIYMNEIRRMRQNG